MTENGIDKRHEHLDDALKQAGVAQEDTGALALDDLELKELAKRTVRDAMLKLGAYTVEGLSDKTRKLFSQHVADEVRGLSIKAHGTLKQDEYWELPNGSVIRLCSMHES